jgi:hypothetical protein
MYNQAFVQLFIDWLHDMKSVEDNERWEILLQRL